MIGFLPSQTERRPVYSVTGQKLCYLEVGPDGEIVYSVSGKKIARLTARHKKWTEGVVANQSLASSVVVSTAEIWNNMGRIK